VVLAINLIAFVALVVLPKTLEPAGRLSSEMSQLIKSKQEIDNDIFIYANKTGEITHSAAYCTCSYTAQCGALPFDLVIFLSLADTTAGAGRVMALCHQLMLRLVSFSPPPLDKLPSPTATEPANQPAHRTARSFWLSCPVLCCFRCHCGMERTSEAFPVGLSLHWCASAIVCVRASPLVLFPPQFDFQFCFATNTFSHCYCCSRCRY